MSPSAFAVLRLMTRSYVVGFSTGSSLGLEPLRILPAKAAARRLIATRFGPAYQAAGLRKLFEGSYDWEPMSDTKLSDSCSVRETH